MAQKKDRMRRVIERLTAQLKKGTKPERTFDKKGKRKTTSVEVPLDEKDRARIEKELKILESKT
jgi:hypothetical protein